MSEKSKIESVLKERGSRYGTLEGNGKVSQRLKRVVRSSKNWKFLSPDKQESIDNIIQKVARILTGDPDYTDNWLDIEGYSRLVREELERKANVDPVLKNIADSLVVKTIDRMMNKEVRYDIFESEQEKENVAQSEDEVFPDSLPLSEIQNSKELYSLISKVAFVLLVIGSCKRLYKYDIATSSFLPHDNQYFVPCATNCRIMFASEYRRLARSDRQNGDPE